MAVQTMSLRGVLEYRLADDERTYFTIDELPVIDDKRTVYSRQFGATEWGWYSGPFYFDAGYRASYEGTA